jgi:hypothetical protein
MSSKRVVAVVICVAVAVASRAMWNQVSVSAESVPGYYDMDALGNLATFTAEPDRGVEPNATRLDRYGNEVDTAIGDYRVDAVGEMYERHSPDTALPQMLPPGV